jgi:hypothetical protein
MMALSTLALSSTMANILLASNRRHNTYEPVQLVSMRDAPEKVPACGPEVPER